MVRKAKLTRNLDGHVAVVHSAMREGGGGGRGHNKLHTVYHVR